MEPINFGHLHYFWVVAKEGGVTRAARRLGVAPQTVSGQLKLLEQSLGQSLLAPEGRGLALTEAGRVALGYADQIFLLGEQLREALSDTEVERVLRLNVGISDAMPKLLAYRLLQPAVRRLDPLRLLCHEGEFEQLLAELALHKLDVVLADRPAIQSGALRLYSHPLGDFRLALFGTRELAARYRAGYPDSLAGAPLLLPTRHTAIRARLDHWFQSRGLRPRVLGEFEDSALLATFGRTGMGLFPGLASLAAEMQEQFEVEPAGEIPGVHEQFFAISADRRIRHPALEALLASRGG